MSWSDRLCRHSAIHRLCARLRTGPGLTTLVLVLVVLGIGGGWVTWHSANVQAAGRAQLLPTPTPTPTPTATVSPTALTDSSAGATQSALPTATATRRPTTTTRTPLPTEVAISTPESPLATPAVAAPPLEIAAPHIAPAAVITVTAPDTATAQAATTQTVTADVGDTAVVTETVVTPEAPLPLATPVPSATQSITDALAMPVAGLGAIIAAAESAAATEPAPATPSIEPTPDGTVRTAHVPVLMYHYVSVPPAGADIYRRDLSVAPELFAEHLDAMLAAGYTAITPYQFLAHLTQGAALPEKPVLLTFDDGYRDNYENAFPLLRDRGMTATFFVVTDFIDDQLPAYFTWDMLRGMHAAGMAIESHGRNHVSLENKDSDYLVWQALGSLETIQYELGARPRFVSYPAGDYDQLTVDIFRSAGYWAGFTTQQGATHHGDDLFQLRRVRVRGTMTAAELVRLMALDW